MFRVNVYRLQKSEREMSWLGMFERERRRHAKSGHGKLRCKNPERKKLRRKNPERGNPECKKRDYGNPERESLERGKPEHENLVRDKLASASSERGNVTVTTLFLMLGLAFLLALTISLASLYIAWTNVNNGLALAKEAVMGSSFQMKVKSVEDPHNVIAQKIVENFRDAGYDQKLTVWCYEEPNDNVNDNVRAIAVYAMAEYPYSLGTLMQPINITCGAGASLVPYSDKQVYKLDIDYEKVDVFQYDLGSSTARQSTTVLKGAPSGLSTAREKALEIADTY